MGGAPSEEPRSSSNQLADELKNKEAALEQERLQKEQLASLIGELEKKLVSGG